MCMWHSQSMLRELIFTRAVTNMALVGPVGLYEGKQSRQTKQAHKHFFKWAKYHHFHKMSLKVELKYILCFVFCFVFFISRCAGSYKVYEMETNENCPDSLPFFCTNPDLPRCGCLALCCCLFMYLKTQFLGGDSALSSEYSFFSDSLCILTHF